MGKIGMDIMSDEEFFEMKDREEKERFLDSLLSATESSTKKMGFSVKSLKKNKSESAQEPTKPTSLSSGPKFLKSNHITGVLNDEQWDDLLDKIDGHIDSPIDDVADREISEFGRHALETLGPAAQDDEDPLARYDKMFKRELAMYAEILRDINIQTRAVAAKLKTLSNGKSQYGVSKYYSEMIEQYNSLNNTKASVIKNMADLKSKAEDFRLKKIKSDGETGTPDRDELVDQYYKTIMNGGRAEYMSRSMLAQSPYEADRNTYQDIIDGSYEMPEGQQIAKASWNITQPIPDDFGDTQTGVDGDKYGNIRNEERQPEICVQRFEDGRLSFIALDKDGLEVEDYELPREDLLETLSIKPMSNFAYDKCGRKYTIIDITTSGVDLSDLDDDNYQYGDN